MSALRGKLREQAEFFCEMNPELGTMDGARGRATDACLSFLESIGIGIDAALDHTVIGKRAVLGAGPVEDHMFVCVGRYSIDFTARQFSPRADFPEAWETP